GFLWRRGRPGSHPEGASRIRAGLPRIPRNRFSRLRPRQLLAEHADGKPVQHGSLLGTVATGPRRPSYSGKPVVLGHTPQTNGQILDLGCLVCMDTDCSRGGWLTAIDTATGGVLQANNQGEVR